MIIEYQSKLNFVYSFQINTSEPSPFKNMLILPNSQLGLVFEQKYIVYDLLQKQNVTSTPLQYPLQSPQLLDSHIIALASNKKNIVKIDSLTGQVIKQTMIQVGNNFLTQDVQLIIFSQSKLICLIYRQQLRQKKIFIFNNNLELIRDYFIEESLLEKFDNVNCLVGYSQIVANKIWIRIFNIEIGVVQKIQISHEIEKLPKSILTVVKRLSNTSFLFGFNMLSKSQWYIFNQQDKNLKLFYQGINIGKLLKLNRSQLSYFGYQAHKTKPEGVLVNVYEDGISYSSPITCISSSFLDHSQQESILIYRSYFKPTDKVSVQIIKSIKKRALVNYLIEKSSLASYGNNLSRTLFKTMDLNNHLLKSKQVQIPVIVESSTDLIKS